MKINTSGREIKDMKWTNYSTRTFTTGAKITGAMITGSLFLREQKPDLNLRLLSIRIKFFL